MTKRVRVYLLDENAKAPEYAHVDDSGMDVFSIEEKLIPSAIEQIVSVGYNSKAESAEDALDYIKPGFAKVRTGIRLEIPEGYEIQIRSKSGLAAKSGLWVLNSPATIDEGFRGELEVILANFSKEPYYVSKGQKIAQIVLCPVEKAEIIVMDDNQRGTGGFGSTGLNKPEVVELKSVKQPSTFAELAAQEFNRIPNAGGLKVLDGKHLGYTVEEAI